MRPELPFLAAGAVALAGGAVRERGWPQEGTGAVIGTVVAVLIASTATGSRFAPLVRAVGLLVLLGAVYAAVPAFTARKER
ncbi:hypothetical protein Aph01nite_76740 [Acrocarpospora phusangensis]|uniref:Uncharacterized protein n=1 Tax=Acrocarpospora phusangensis TaxID=1070424 RepID=A0A919QJP8_9ACTN|nr:hypothetical protein [Acrocarpospora phusangensis]GIH29364.1 hypothetical protein Aph01nite_76740 [Acrocarpospora phusangensis]